MKNILGFLLVGFISITYANESYYKNGVLVKLEKMHASRAYKGSYIEYYKTVQGQKIGITDEILVECKDGVNCSKLLSSYNLVNYSNLTDKILIVKIDDYDNIFAISRKLFESGDVKYAHPNFIKERKRR